MKQNSRYVLALAALAVLAAAPPVLAAGPAAQSSRFGTEIRKAEVAGYTLTYTLIGTIDMNFTSVMPMSSYDGGHMKSHHLMVFVNRADGRPVTQGEARFTVDPPSRPGSRIVARPMDGGFGNDVDLPFRGDYTITAQLALPDADVEDRFAFTVK